MWADQAFERFLKNPLNNGYVIDIGCGKGEHAAAMEDAGIDVWRHDFAKDGDYLKRWYPQNHWAGVWASHVLEHFPNPNAVLKKIYRETQIGAPVAITVPPHKDEIVGGHVTLWNTGILLYQMILAGFDCRYAICGRYGYNLSVLVDKKPILLYPELKNDHGDIDLLSKFFPGDVAEGFNGLTGIHYWS